MRFPRSTVGNAGMPSHSQDTRKHSTGFISQKHGSAVLDLLEASTVSKEMGGRGLGLIVPEHTNSGAEGGWATATWEGMKEKFGLWVWGRPHYLHSKCPPQPGIWLGTRRRAWLQKA